MRQKAEFYQDKSGEWRWRFKSNGRVMADSAEGYKTKGNAERAWSRLCGYILEGAHD